MRNISLYYGCIFKKEVMRGKKYHQLRDDVLSYDKFSDQQSVKDIFGRQHTWKWCSDLERENLFLLFEFL